jgi:small subunit ribosomal protein S21
LEVVLPQIDVRSHDDFNMVIRNFRMLCERAGVVSSVKKKEFYEKPKWTRKMVKNNTAKRLKRKIMREKMRRTRLY